MTQLPNDSELSSLASLGDDLFRAEQKVLQLEAQLKQAKRDRDDIANVQVPDLMREIGVEDITMSGGRKVAVKPILSVTPLKENRPLVLEELAAQGAGSLIKTNVTVPFGRGDEAKVKELLNLLQEKGLAAKTESKVEPQTLKAHIRRRLEEGLPVDQKLFGVRQFERAEFTEGKPTTPVFDGE